MAVMMCYFKSYSFLGLYKVFFHLLILLFLSCFAAVSVAYTDEPILTIDDVEITIIDPYSQDDIIPTRVGSKADYYDLIGNAKYLKDTSKSLTINDVSDPSMATEFSQISSDMLNLGITNNTYWIKFQIQFPLQNLSSARHKKWLLTVSRAQLDTAKLYMPEKGKYKEVISDVSILLSEKPVQSAESIFPIEISAGEKKTFFLKVASGNALFLPLSLWDRVAFVEKVSVEEYLFGAFFGAMIILILYNFFLYLSISDASYLFYSLSFLLFAIFEFIELGHGFTIFGDASRFLSKSIQPYLLWGAWGAVILFSRSFLDTKNKFEGIDFILLMTLVAGTANVVMSFAMEFYITQLWLSGASMGVMILVAWVSYYVWAKGNPSAFFFLIPWIVGIFGGITYSLVLLGVLPPIKMFIYSAPLGILVSSLLLSFALADRIRRMRKQALLANANAMKSLSRFESLFNNAVEGMYRMNLDGELVSVNPSMANIMGYTSVKKLMVSSNKCVGNLFPNYNDQMDDLLEEGHMQKQQSYELVNGEVIWTTHTAQVIYDAEGDPSHIEGTLVDITTRVERENVEQEVERERIEREVAEASAMAKSSFLANMSHEIRTPLTAIIGYSEILADPSLDKKESDQSLDTVIRSGHHLLELINDILDMSNIEAQRLEVDCQPLEIFTLLRDIEAYFALKAEEKSIKFKLDYQFPLPTLILADLTRLKQILLNLCSNAIKFTNDGEVIVRVSWSEEGQVMSFSVQDTGIGLSEAQRNKLFQAYGQADSSTAREFGGTGLGLVISKQLAEMMGGDIIVTSEEGKGSCFTTTIGGGLAEGHRWLHSEDEIKVDELVPEISGGNIPELSGHVLVAEDDEDNRYLIKLMLNKTGATTTFVENGLKAVEYVQENPVNLVLMDMHMPVMNGMDATQAIRALGLDVPVVAISAGVLEEDQKAYEDAGCDAVLAKPIVRTLFYQEMMKHLGKAYANRDSFELNSA